MTKPMSDERREAKERQRLALAVNITLMLSEGATNDQIKRRLGIGYDKILMIKREYGLVYGGGNRGASKRPNVKLNEAKVRAMRKLRDEIKMPYSQLGLLFGVSKVSAWKVCNGWWSGVK